MYYHNLLFDLDGTLIDSGPGILNSAVYALEQLGYTPPTKADMHRMIGPPLPDVLSDLGVPKDRLDEGIRLYRKKYNDFGEKFNNYLYDGIADMLRRLKANGFSLYVATSKHEGFAKEILQKHGIYDLFDAIAGSSPTDNSRNSKASVLTYLLNGIGGKKSSSVLIGDTKYDAIGAKEVGIPCIGVSWGYGNMEEMRALDAKAIADSPQSLLSILIHS